MVHKGFINVWVAFWTYNTMLWLIVYVYMINMRCYIADVVELQKAKDQNERLNEEIRVLRGRVRCLDTERKGLLEMVKNNI